tara:strand:- start:1238 stop:1516 length:279 start_codon:yes stop_codon:yes gene_type:complete
MSAEILKKKNPENVIELKNKINNNKQDTLENKISNFNQNNINKPYTYKNKKKICINSLQDRLRKKAERKKYESRILYSLLISAVTILFFVST